MTNTNHFTPRHITAKKEDLIGNNGIGRYILLPESDGRAKAISKFFDNLTIQHHPRNYDLYLGTLSCDGQQIDVATISSGIGCPSMEIILHELFHLGAKRFLRVGTSGSLQPTMVKIGDIINAQASVRDESTTIDYVPATVPAVASLEMMSAISDATEKLGLSNKLHTGMVHCKASFYAREFSAGPKSAENDAHLDLLTRCGILASEMETAALFIQSYLYNYQLMSQGRGPAFKVIYGAILGVVTMPPHEFATAEQEALTTKDINELALETIKCLWRKEDRELQRLL